MLLKLEFIIFYDSTDSFISGIEKCNMTCISLICISSLGYALVTFTEPTTVLILLVWAPYPNKYL